MEEGSMAKLPEPFGMSVTVKDLDSAKNFYTRLYHHDGVKGGVFAGIRYLSLMRDGETCVNIFEAGADNPLQDVFPTLKVDSVPGYVEKIQSIGGKVVVPPSTCPCTETAFAIVADDQGNQLMLKEPRTSIS
jgi:predicted enzyme related to lactoylglutathione lyase